MGESILRPLFVYGPEINVRHAYKSLRRIIESAHFSEGWPYREDHGMVARHDLHLLGAVLVAANDTAFFTFPPSGGKVGGGIQKRWERYVSRWKAKVSEDQERLGIYVDWVELEVGEVEVARIKDTSTDYSRSENAHERTTK